jgi:hypothetical protein
MGNIVYLAFILYDYEGGILLGAYDSREKAEQAYLNYPYKGDDHEIVECVLNDSMEKGI